MSHTSIYKGILVKNLLTLKAVAKQTGLASLDIGQQEVTMYGQNRVNSIAKLQVSGWRYPIAIDGQGRLWYDNFGSSRESMSNLGKLLQQYAKAEVLAEAGQSEEVLCSWAQDKENGDIEILLDYA